jgi:hypothetical protein
LLCLFTNIFSCLQKPTVILEAVSSQDMWIWHAYFGMPGSHKDINVLDSSPLFQNLLYRKAPKCTFSINGNTYNQGYYLADGIYPDWSTFVKTLSQPWRSDGSILSKCKNQDERTSSKPL